MAEIKLFPRALWKTGWRYLWRHALQSTLMVLGITLGVAVVVEALHLCSMMRGVRKQDARMTTSAMHGAFRSNLATRQEFLDNISRGASALHI